MSRRAKIQDRKVAFTLGLLTIMGMYGCSDEATVQDVTECPDNMLYDTHKGECVDKVTLPTCDTGEVYDTRQGKCVPEVTLPTCDTGEVYDTRQGKCVPEVTLPTCDTGEVYDTRQGKCVAVHCDLGQYLDPDTGKCVPVCKCNEMLNADGVCIPDTDNYPDNEQMRQKALQETMLAFYRRGDYIQYEVPRSAYGMAPEDATSQSIKFTMCNAFAYQVYKQALGIVLPDGAPDFADYGQKHNNDPETVYYDDALEEQLRDDTAKDNFVQIILESELKPGDILGYYDTTNKTGHVALIYDLILNDEQQPVDAIVIHSTDSTNDKEFTSTQLKETGLTQDTISVRLTKITSNGLIWHSAKREFIPQYKNSSLIENINWEYSTITEGTVQVSSLSTYIHNRTCGGDCEMTILRPMKSTKKYYEFNSNEKYKVPDSSWCRIKHPKIDIEKTVDIHRGSTVEPGELLEYTIRIKNNSDSAYKNLYVIENIPNAIDTIEEYGGGIYHTTHPTSVYGEGEYKGALDWMINEIPAGEESTIRYKVRVANDPALIGKTIYSTGSAGGISSGVIENMIAYGLSDAETTALINSFNSIAESKTNHGLSAIRDAYNDANLGYLFNSYDLTKLILAKLYLKDSITHNTDSILINSKTELENNLKKTTPKDNYYCANTSFLDFSLSADVKIPNFECSTTCPDSTQCDTEFYKQCDYSFIQTRDTNVLIKSYYYATFVDEHSDSIQINQNHPLARMLLNHYYSGLYTKYHCMVDKNNKAVIYTNEYIKQRKYDYSSGPEPIRTDRNEFIYKETLKTGDILIISNHDRTYGTSGNPLVIVTNNDEPYSNTNNAFDNGIYAYLYIDDKFIGIDENNSIRKIMTSMDSDFFKQKNTKYYYYDPEHYRDDIKKQRGLGIMLRHYGTLPTLFGKDFYVILRPALMKKHK